MNEIRLSLGRRLLPWLLALALLVLAIVAGWRTLALREELTTQVRAQLEDELQDRITSWEDSLYEQLEGLLEDAAANPAHAWITEAGIRGKAEWFDSLYVWRTRQRRFSHGVLEEVAPQFLFPVPPADELDFVTGSPCSQRADIYEFPADVEPAEHARAVLAACSEEPMAVRLWLTSQLAVQLDKTHRMPDAALRVIEEGSGLDHDAMSLRAGIQKNLDPSRLVTQRLQRAEYLSKTGRDDLAFELYERTGREIVALDAPELRGVLDRVGMIVDKLDDASRTAEANRLDLLRLKAERRLRAYEEIGDRILPRSSSQTSEAPRFIYDQYSDPPFLLFYGPAGDGDMGVGLQMDQQRLLQDFLDKLRRSSLLRNYVDSVVVTEAGTGALVAGARRAGPVVVEVPFSRTLTHLRVGLRQEAVDARMAALDDQWVIPMIVVVFCVVLGVVALVAQLRADRQQLLLLVRQREFTTRVTHELKTPLAGIKVMAENLESGAYRSEREQRQAALRIVQEADRLAERVEEILAVARERKVPNPEPFDPEEAVLEAIDTWGPRLELGGVVLEADLDATEPIVGDMAAYRDAVGCLLDNALKYRDEGKEPSHVWLALRQDGKNVVLEVADDGIGVPADMREAIFEQFVRVEGNNRGKSGGHGLGLAQVKETAERHGGRVRCEDGTDGGAKFVLEIPSQAS
jgi:signal transduction histidine kinase